MKKNSLKAKLVGKIPEELIDKVNRSFEVVGDIAIIEISEELEKYEKQIGDALLDVNVSLKTILKKSGIHHGEFRTQDLVYVSGVEKYETEYLENGVRFKLNPGKVYFSARLSTERSELIEKLDEKQRVLVMFSGAGPYSLTALKYKPNLPLLTAIEINPDGHKYACESFTLNKNFLKKTKEYQNFVKFVKAHKLPALEKETLPIFNKTKVNFINGNVRIETKEFKPKFYDKKIDFYDNNIFDYEFKNIYHILDQLKDTKINIDVEKIHKLDEFINFFILFFDKFQWVAKIKNKDYLFETALDKSVFLEYLRNQSNRKLEELFLYDEIYMPLPKDAELFLDCTFRSAAPGAIVHMYDFAHENDFPIQSENAVLKAAEKNGVKVEIIETRKVGQYSPRKYRVCCDFKIL
jgi:tRNA G37 N-methylase Trm5